MSYKSPTHGTLVMYNKYKCRCEECRTARREYNRIYQARWRAAYPHYDRDNTRMRRSLRRAARIDPSGLA